MASNLKRPHFRRIVLDMMAEKLDNLLAMELPVPSCLSCVYFNEQQEACRKFNNMRPPARIIANSCDEYMDNQDVPY